MIIYNDTEKELSMNDYRPLPDLTSLSCTDLIELLENLYQANENAFLNGSALLENELYNDIISVNRYRTEFFIRTAAAGTIARIINNTKYTEIEKAVYWALDYIIKGENPEQYFDIGTTTDGIYNLILNVYQTGKRTEKA